jgi:hypothetical protein
MQVKEELESLFMKRNLIMENRCKVLAEKAQKVRMFVLCRHFQFSLMLWVRQGATQELT